MTLLFARRRHSVLLPLPRHRRRHLSSPSAATNSAAAAESLLRTEFDPDKALSILSSTPDPSPSSIELAVRRLFTARRFSDIEPLIESLKKSPHASQEPFLSALIFSYGKARMIDHAVRTFDDDVPRLTSSPPTLLSFNALLSACIRANRSRRVLGLFRELSAKHFITPDAASYAILIKSLCVTGRSEKAFAILKEMAEKKIEPDTVIYTTLLHSLYKEGKFKEAEELWEEMVSKGCAPDLAAYNVRIMYYASNGKPEEVLRVIDEMESAGLKPDTITENYLMTAYCKSGRFEVAREVYERIKGKESGPNHATFKHLLGFLTQNGDLDWGLEVFRESVKRNMIPESRMLMPFVEELVKGSRIDEAKVIIDEVKKKFPEDLVNGWKELDKKLCLNVEEEAADQAQAAHVQESPASN